MVGFEEMAEQIEIPISSTCVRCGQVHVTKAELLDNKLTLDYSYALIAYATGYDRLYIRRLIKGKEPVSCRANIRLRKWLETARPMPWLSLKSNEELNKESIRAQKVAGKTALWLKTDSFAFNWKLFQCKGCKGLFVGLLKQVRCMPCEAKEYEAKKSRGRLSHKKKSLQLIKSALKSVPPEIPLEKKEPPQS